MVGVGNGMCVTPLKRKAGLMGALTSPRKSRGLKHTSLRVKAAVERKGMTTYGEVADELVAESCVGGEEGKECTESDNLRRRVYDVLNVFDAAGIIRKEDKQICWVGLPVGDEPERREGGEDMEDGEDGMDAKSLVDAKKAVLSQLVEQHAALLALLRRNEDRPIDSCPPVPRVLQLPFIVIHVPANGAVEVQISQDVPSSCVRMDFHDVPFVLHDDLWLLRMMDLHRPTAKAPHSGARCPMAVAHDPLALPPLASAAVLDGIKAELRPPMMLFKESQASSHNAHNFANSLDDIIGMQGGGQQLGDRMALFELRDGHGYTFQPELGKAVMMDVAESSNLTDIRAGAGACVKGDLSMPPTTGTPTSEVPMALA
ncbi:unnamed protein product [Ostreobium quekettii]|uniref:Uncharacterized protein n=1 Tax=Ostreobium quekettii TaxID=121088 RepID=A0A8S1INS2_9CHLO|nr:unnamed protein product [Ostreobium quekettii]